jgi:nondiscriminating glutamyl-tRNA synthetase
VSVKTRFAPSPTGLLHFGNVRTALFNALFVKSTGGSFLLRVEDTDVARSREDYVKALQDDLHWLGLHWQEGEGAGGDAGPYRQSQRTDVYETHLGELDAKGLVYSCFCTPLELEVSRKVQASAGQPPRYSGKCAHLNAEEVAAKKAQGMTFALRFRMPKGAVIEFGDLVRGPQRFPSDDIGDFIIRRSDGSFAFFFVNAVDDALMGVTHVMRGEDHLTNTPRQIALLQALGLPVPTYAHISLIVDKQGAPLSKRSGSLSVRELKELGYFAGAVNNYLARLGHHFAETRFLTVDELAAQFSPEHLGRAPARYDRTQLDHWQAQAVAHADAGTITAWLLPAMLGMVPTEDFATFAEAVRNNVLFPHDAKLWAEAVYADALPLSDRAREVLEATPSEFFRHALQALQPDMDFDAFARRVKAASGASGKQLFQPLRAALTGHLHGPEMPRLFRLIRHERAKRRLSEHVLNTHVD